MWRSAMNTSHSGLKSTNPNKSVKLIQNALLPYMPPCNPQKYFLTRVLLATSPRVFGVIAKLFGGSREICLWFFHLRTYLKGNKRWASVFQPTTLGETTFKMHVFSEKFIATSGKEALLNRCNYFSSQLKANTGKHKGRKVADKWMKSFWVGYSGRKSCRLTLIRRQRDVK